jgi:putative sigma-54 modulation protein
VQVKVAARHGRLSGAARQQVVARVERLSRYFDRLTSIEVTVDLERPGEPEVDLRVSAEHKHDFCAVERGEGLHSAVDGAVHKLEQQLRKYKEKVQGRHRSPPAGPSGARRAPPASRG